MKYTATFFFPFIKGGIYKSARNIDIPKINELIDNIIHDNGTACIMRVYEGKYAPYDSNFNGLERDKLVAEYIRYNQAYYDTHSNMISSYVKSLNKHCK